MQPEKLDDNVNTPYGETVETDDVLGVALDLSAGGTSSLDYKNGVSMGVAYNNLDCNLSYLPAVASYGSGTGTANFGQKTWAYAPPVGYKSLSHTNL